MTARPPSRAFPSPKFYNPQMRMHGGYAATLIDSATGCAVQTKLPAGIGYGTIELKVNYVRKIDAVDGPAPLHRNGDPRRAHHVHGGGAAHR